MTYEEYLKERERNREKLVSYAKTLMIVEWNVKSIFKNYEKGNVSESKALKQLRSALIEWKDAKEAIDALEKEQRELAKEVEL